MRQTRPAGLDLLAWLDQIGIDYQVVEIEKSTPTVEAAATAAGVEPERIIKSVLFANSRDEAVLAVSGGTLRIDRHAVSSASGLTGLKLASPEIVLRVTGFPAGTVPPIGQLQPIPVILDPSVAQLDWVLGGCGHHANLIRLEPVDIAALTQAVVALIRVTG